MDSQIRPVSETELLENLAWVQVLARRLVSDPATAEDVAQDAWLTALERPPQQVSGGAGFRAWLSRVTRTLARQSLRSAASRSAREQTVARGEAMPSALDVVARAEMQQRIVEVVLSLEEPAKTTILLHHLDGLSSKAIAEELGETPAAVRKRLSRAHARLRARLERELGDDGRSWIQALVPLALGGGGGQASVVLGKSLGGVLMSKASWTVGVAAAVIAFMAVGWFFLSGVRPSSTAAGGESGLSALPSVEPSAAGEVEEATPELAGPEEAESGRMAVDVEAPPPGPVYVLVDPEGNPVAGAELLLCRDGGVLARGVTDAEGHFTPEYEEEGEAKLLALATGWPAQVHEVSLEPETHAVSLHSGAVLSGLIVVNGGRPAERIPFVIVADGVLLDFEEELGVPADDLGVSRSLWKVVRTRAAEDGSFRFDGLPLGWSGDLVLPRDYRLTDPTKIQNELSPSRLHLDEAAENLRIEVTKELALRGRVVDLREGTLVPVPDVNVLAVLEYAKPGAGQGYAPQTYTDPDGEFRFCLQDTSVRGGYLYLRTFDDTLSRKVDLEPREVHEDWDLGDVLLVDPETTSTVRLLVLDPANAPISGAVAGVDATSPISEPTDSRGHTELRGVVPGGPPIVIYAVGYKVEKTAVPEEVPEDLVVNLEKGAGMELRFLTANEEPARGLQACFRASHHPIREGEKFPTSILALLNSGCSTYRWIPVDEETGNLFLHTDREGRLIVNDLEPGVSLFLSVAARSGQLLLERDIAPLAPKEWRIVDIDLGEGPREFHGKLVDEAGNPVRRASIMVSLFPTGEKRGGSRNMSTGVEEDGSFTISGLYTPTVSFSVHAQGYVTLSIKDYELPADERQVEFRLESGHDVLVHIADEEGRPVPARVRVRLLGETQPSYVRAAESELGAYLLRDLPEEEVTIHARVHGVSYSRPHDPRIPELQIEVPVLGALEATIRNAAESELDDNCHLWLFPQGGSDLVRRYGILDPTGESPVLLPDILLGTYEAVLRRWHRPEEIPSELSDTWFEEYPDEQFEELTPRVPVMIEAGKTTRVEIPH